MVTNVLERYDSENGSFAEIERLPDMFFRVSIYTNTFHRIFSRETASSEFARKLIDKYLPHPYTRTV